MAISKGEARNPEGKNQYTRILSNETHPLAEVVAWVVSHGPKEDQTHEQVYYRKLMDRKPELFEKIRVGLSERQPPVDRPAAGNPHETPSNSEEPPFEEIAEDWKLFHEWARSRVS